MTIGEDMDRQPRTRPAAPPRRRSAAPPGRAGRHLGAAAALVAGGAAVALTPTGHRVLSHALAVADFYAGVVTLILLTGTVLGGLLATDRLVLTVRHRVWLQSAHRGAGLLAAAALLLHVALKVAGGAVTPVDAAAPFLAAGRAGFLGLGAVGGYLLLAVCWTGVVRARFAATGRPWVWRALHSTAYLAWPAALLHGLTAGRPPAPWVTAGYLGCAGTVTVALAVRLAVGPELRRPVPASSAGRTAASRAAAVLPAATATPAATAAPAAAVGRYPMPDPAAPPAAAAAGFAELPPDDTPTLVDLAARRARRAARADGAPPGPAGPRGGRAAGRPRHRAPATPQMSDEEFWAYLRRSAP